MLIQNRSCSLAFLYLLQNNCSQSLKIHILYSHAFYKPFYSLSPETCKPREDKNMNFFSTIIYLPRSPRFKNQRVETSVTTDTTYMTNIS